VASLRKPLEEIFEADPDAYWDTEANQMVSELGESSPRVRIVPLYNPNQSLQGRDEYVFNNFARIFLDGGGGIYDDPNDFAIYARFMGVVTSGSGGPSQGTLVRYLRLVE
jgi:hypothetical protein